ncbi:MAG: carbohydrate-binding protein [Fibrobacter sp.]|nr:carbohydrate-binding protein [Fibrobacter sp.]
MNKNFKKALPRAVGATLVAGLATFGLAENPISSYHYLADPSAASDGDTFYILTDTDDMCVSTDPFQYNIIGLYAFSSKDMVNWTDHGLIFQSKREFGTYPGNTWASGIAVRNGRPFIVYPDGASGVGMITAPSIDGPYTDPIREAYNVNYIAANWGGSVIGGCDDIDHCFDPGIFFDDDGSGYVIFGGGSASSQKRPIGNNFDLIKFSESNGKVTVDKNSLKRISAEKSFEAPYIHKHGDWYYISFNNSSQEIGYGMSKNPAGPYTYKGIAIGAVWQINDCETHSCDGGNNHQGFADFKGKTYAVYHDRRLVRAKEHPASLGVADPEPGNHRSVSIDEITYAADGTINKLTFTKEGPKQVGKFDPYNTYKALTSSKQRNVRSRTDWTKGQPVKHVLTPLATKESWIRVTGVDFGNGAENLRIKAANVGDGNKIEIRKGSVSGTLAGSCELAKTSGWQAYTDNDCAMTGLTGVVDQLFMIFKGTKDSTMGILEWEFQGTKREPEPQTPFGGKATPIPGKLEMENFDEPGYGAGNDSYYENDEEDHGETEYRKGTGVDIYKKATGYIVGYNQKGEWLEYTVNVAKDGDYTMYAAVASANETSGFQLSVDGKALTDTIMVPKAASGEENYDDYNKVKRNISLTAGSHIIRFTVTGDWMDIDYINFLEGKDAPDTEPIPGKEEDPSLAIGSVKFDVASAAEYNVFDLQGHLKGSVSLTGKNAVQALNAAGFAKGVYMLKQVSGSKKMLVNSAK